MKNILISIALLSLVVSQSACGGSEKPKEEEHDHEHGGEPSNTTTLTTDQIKSIGIEMGYVESKQLTSTIRANGVLRVPNQNKALVNSLYRGVIKSLLVQPGEVIKKGQVIATVSNPDFMLLQEEYLGIGPKIELAELEHKRQQELNQGNAGALKNLQLAESNLRALNTRKAGLEQQIQHMGISPKSLSNGKLVSVLSLHSPIGGIVSNVSVQMGSFVDVTTPIAEIVDNSQLHLDLFVYEKDLPKLRNNQRIHFTLTNNPGKEYDAEIFSLGSSFENESKAVSVHARVIGEKNGLIDGMNITALVSLDKITAPAVPSDAIVTDKGQDYILMVTSSGGEAAKQDHDHDHDHAGHDHAGHDHAKTDTAGEKHDHDHAGHDHGKPGTAEAKQDHDHEKDHKHDTKEATATKPGEVSFEKVPVVKGTTEVGYTQITLLKSIPSNAKIVTKGAFFVLAKMNNAGAAGHSH